MPEMNGIEAIKAILNINSEAVILVCSASNQQDMIFDALEAGAKGYLMKPFKPDQMNHIIEKYAVAHLRKTENAAKQEESDMVSAEDELAITAHFDLDTAVNADMDEDNTGDSVAASVIVSNEYSNEGESVDLSVESSNESNSVDSSMVTSAALSVDEEIAQSSEDGNPEEPVQKEELAGNVIPLMKGSNKMRSFVSSLMCQWEEDIDDQNIHYNVICIESENKLKIEMATGSSQKQSIELTIDGFMQLGSWLEGHMRSKTS
jgi:YesN/AraC family two-component response regulator